MALKLAFQQKRIAAGYSIVFLLQFMTWTKQTKLRHIANMYLTVNDSS